MENQIIAKTLLTIWPGLTDYEKMLASRAQTHALCSFHTPLLTERIIDKIIALNVKQQTVHTLRTGLDRVIAQLPYDVRRVVTAHYQNFAITGHAPVIAARLGISERSYFRKLATATHWVAQRLPHLGINFFTWQNLLRNHPWIKETFVRQR